MILTKINKNLDRIATALEVIAKIPTISIDETKNSNVEFSSPDIQEFEDEEKRIQENLISQAIKDRNGEEQFFEEDVVPVELLDQTF